MILLYSYITYYILSSIGITFGYHRYFAHNEYRIPKIFEIVLLYIGLLCGGQSPLTWCGVHRMHHAYSDTPNDPHSPLYNSWWRILLSLWRVNNIPRKFVKDLYMNQRVMFFHKHGSLILAFTYFFTIVFVPYIFAILLIVYVMSYLFYGFLNLFGHSKTGSVNRWWINAFAPFEGRHYDHHIDSHKQHRNKVIL